MNNALYDNQPGDQTPAELRKSMPPPHVLAEYPDLQKRWAGVMEAAAPSAAVGQSAPDQGQRQAVEILVPEKDIGRDGASAKPDPAAELKAFWAAQGVPIERQAELLAQIGAKAQPGAQVGPFIVGGRANSETPKPSAYDQATPARLLTNEQAVEKWEKFSNSKAHEAGFKLLGHAPQDNQIAAGLVALGATEADFRELWADTKHLDWPASYGQSPWGRAQVIGAALEAESKGDGRDWRSVHLEQFRDYAKQSASAQGQAQDPLKSAMDKFQSEVRRAHAVQKPSAYDKAIQSFVRGGGTEKDARSTLDSAMAGDIDPKNLSTALVSLGFAQPDEAEKLAAAIIAEENQKVLDKEDRKASEYQVGLGDSMDKAQADSEAAGVETASPGQPTGSRRPTALDRAQELHKSAVEGYDPLASWENLSATADRNGLKAHLDFAGVGPTSPTFLITYVDGVGQRSPVTTFMHDDGKALTSVDGKRMLGTGYTAETEWQRDALQAAITQVREPDRQRAATPAAAPHELTFAAFSADATAGKLQPEHGRQWEVFYGKESLGFADAPTEDGALRQVHEREVNNALYGNQPDAPEFLRKSMPPENVLAEYPGLQKLWARVIEAQQPAPGQGTMTQPLQAAIAERVDIPRDAAGRAVLPDDRRQAAEANVAKLDPITDGALFRVGQGRGTELDRAYLGRAGLLDAEGDLPPATADMICVQAAIQEKAFTAAFGPDKAAMLLNRMDDATLKAVAGDSAPAEAPELERKTIHAAKPQRTHQRVSAER